MNKDMPIKKEKMKYQKVSYETRIEILNKIINERCSYKEVSRLYGVKYGTARQIHTRFLNEGQIEKKKKRQKETLVETNINLQIYNPITQQMSQTLHLQNKQQIKCFNQGEFFRSERVRQAQYQITQELINRTNQTIWGKIPVGLQSEQYHQDYCHLVSNLVGSWHQLSQFIINQI